MRTSIHALSGDWQLWNPHKTQQRRRDYSPSRRSSLCPGQPHSSLQVRCYIILIKSPAPKDTFRTNCLNVQWRTWILHRNDKRQVVFGMVYELLKFLWEDEWERQYKGHIQLHPYKGNYINTDKQFQKLTKFADWLKKAYLSCVFERFPAEDNGNFSFLDCTFAYLWGFLCIVSKSEIKIKIRQKAKTFFRKRKRTLLFCG